MAAFLASVIIPVLFFGLVVRIPVNEGITRILDSELEQIARLAKGMVETSFEIGQGRVNADLRLAKELYTRDAVFNLDQGSRRTAAITNQSGNNITTLQIPALTRNGQDVYRDTVIPDRFKVLSGSDMTVFTLVDQGLVRTSTTVTRGNGELALNTYIDSNQEVYQRVAAGQAYYGIGKVLDTEYLTVYDPLTGPGGQVIGALFVGVPLSAVTDRLVPKLQGIRIGENGYIFVLNRDGRMVASQNGREDGQLVLGENDLDGNLVYQNLVDTATTENAGTLIPLDFRKNDSEGVPRRYVGRAVYDPIRQWVIAAVAEQAEFAQQMDQIQRVTLLVLLGFAAVGGVLAFVISRFLAKPIQHIVLSLQGLAQGDFSHDIPDTSRITEMKQLIQSLNEGLIPNLRSVMGEVRESSKQGRTLGSKVDDVVDTSSATMEELQEFFATLQRDMERLTGEVSTVQASARAIAQAADAQDHSITEQTTAINQTSAAVEEMSASISNVNRIAKEKGSASRSLSEATVQGERTVTEMNGVVQNISQGIGQISNVITVINDIAERTNLLAMNAAIEAAHAGDAGRGFAVVAQEIRKLAASSSENARIISDFLRKTLDQILAMQEAGDSTTKSFGEVSQQVQVFVQAFSEITSSTDELAAGTHEIVSSMNLLQNQGQSIKDKSRDVAGRSEKIVSAVQDVQGFLSKNVGQLEYAGTRVGQVAQGQQTIQGLSKENMRTMAQLEKKVDLFILDRAEKKRS